MKLVVFTSLKPPIGVSGEIQRKALSNWREFFPGVEILNFETSACGAEDLGLDVRTVVLPGNGRVPTFNAMVKWLFTHTESELLLYSNGDLLFDGSLMKVCEAMPQGNFLLTGQRIDRTGDGEKRLHRPCGMDYFLFRRGLFLDLPPVVMGRSYCDSALVAYCLRKRVPVIDASYSVRVEHQFHDYGHIAGGRRTVCSGDAARQNLVANGLRSFASHCIDATQTLLPNGLLVPNIRASVLRKLEVDLFYRRGWRRCPPFNAIWNLLTRGGRYGKNPHWPDVKDIR